MREWVTVYNAGDEKKRTQSRRFLLVFFFVALFIIGGALYIGYEALFTPEPTLEIGVDTNEEDALVVKQLENLERIRSTQGGNKDIARKDEDVEEQLRALDRERKRGGSVKRELTDEELYAERNALEELRVTQQQ